DDPGIVAGRDLVDIAGNEVHGRAVVHDDVQLPADHEADVPVLALRGPGDRADVVRPSPARLELEFPEHDVIEGDEAQLAIGEFPDLLGVDEVPALETGHGQLL